jgi:hypothetical protein
MAVALALGLWQMAVALALGVADGCGTCIRGVADGCGTCIRAVALALGVADGCGRGQWQRAEGRVCVEPAVDPAVAVCGAWMVGETSPAQP